MFFYWGYNMNVQLTEIKQNELISAWHMQIKGFIPVFLKYFDRVNPIFNTYGRFKRRYKNKNIKEYWIECDGKRVGELFLGFKEDCILLARIFVLKRYWNMGIAQEAIICAENMFSKYKIWKLDTIKQESRNCHLYEKLGYSRTGNEKVINKRMTIVDYEKIM